MDDDFELPDAGEEMNEDFDLPHDNLILKVGEEKEIGKQGLKKKLVKDGEGWERPDNGDEVEGIFLPRPTFITNLYFWKWWTVLW